MNQALEVMLPATGEWVRLAEWDCSNSEYDAFGWCDSWAERIGTGVAPLPNGGRVDLSAFCAIRPVRLS